MRDCNLLVPGSGNATLSEQPLTLFDCMNALMSASTCGLSCSKLTTRAVAVAVGGTAVALGTAGCGCVGGPRGGARGGPPAPGALGARGAGVGCTTRGRRPP